jgi:molybdopterin converting factor small subunit
MYNVCVFRLFGQLEDVLKTTQEDVRMTEDELATTHEFVKHLQKQADRLQQQLDTQYLFTLIQILALHLEIGANRMNSF